MKTKQQALTELERTTEKRKTEIETEYAVLDTLPSQLLTQYKLTFHTYHLYDRRGTLTLRWQRYASIQTSNNPTSQTIRELAEALPYHLPVVLYRDGCLGVRTAKDAEMLSGESTPIAPVWIEFDPHNQDASVHWIAESVVGPIDVRVEFPSSHLQKIATPITRYDRYQDGRVRHVISNELSVTSNATYIGNSKAFVTRFASGDRAIPGQLILTWQSLTWQSGDGEHGAVTPHDIATILDC